MLPSIVYPLNIAAREAFLLESDAAIDSANSDIIARLVAVRDSKAWDYPNSPYTSFRDWAGERHGYTDPHRKIKVAGIAESMGVEYESSIIDSHLYALKDVEEPETRKKIWDTLESASKVTAPTVKKVVTLAKVDEDTFELLGEGKITLNKAAKWVDTLEGISDGIQQLIDRHDIKLLLIREPEIVQQLKLIELTYPDDFLSLINSGHVPINGHSIPLKTAKLHDLLRWKTRLQTERLQMESEKSDEIQIDVITIGSTSKIAIDLPFSVNNTLNLKIDLENLLTKYR